MVKQIYFEPSGRIHPGHQAMLNEPPDGYQFVLANGTWDKGVRTLLRSDFLLHSVAAKIDRFLPLHLIKARMEGFARSAPREADLTYAVNHTVFRNEPWVAFLECVTAPAGFTLARLRKRRKMIEDAFASDCCKKILVWSELTLRSVVTSLDCSRFGAKLEIVHFAPPRKEFTKSHRADRVRLLFLGTANAPGVFELRGGRETLEAFTHLARRFKRLKLVIRSDVPPAIMAKYQGHPDIQFIEGVLPSEELDQLFKTADIFLFPAYYSPWMTTLDAMSYELPVITTDVYANPEMIQDGVTGFIIKTSNVPRWSENFTPPNTAKDPQYERAIRGMDPEIVQGLVQKLSILIEDKQLRSAMGYAARQEVEQGRFSPVQRNKKLERIFGEATASCSPLRPCAAEG